MPVSAISGRMITATDFETYVANFEKNATTGEVKSCFYGINKILTILGQDGCIGIRIHGAINGDNKKTFALVGVDSDDKELKNNNFIAEYGILESIS